MSRVQSWMIDRTGRYQVLGIVLLLAFTTVPLLLAIDSPMHGDVRLYLRVCDDLAGGQIPYRDRELEYPPYAILIFWLPWIVSHGGYQFAFAVAVIIADGVLKALLAFEACNDGNRHLVLLSLGLYCVAIQFMSYFYLQRYDIFPALLAVISICLLARGRCGWAGAVLSVAVGVKLYPALLAPVLWVVAIQRACGMRFALGMGWGLFPLAALSFFLPWWRFLTFHASRGLQVESLYASLVWLSHLAGFTEARWTFVKAWTEVTGPMAITVLPWAKLLMTGSALASVGFASWAAWRVPNLKLYRLARLCLIPLLAFVSFNIVLSPQFLIWLLPLAALGILDGKRWPMVLIGVCTSVSSIIYPSPQYMKGFNLFLTIVLLARNLTLVVVWVVLIREFWQMARKPMEVSTARLPE